MYCEGDNYYNNLNVTNSIQLNVTNPIQDVNNNFINNNGNRSQREFQSVNNYGISHMPFEDRSNIRKHYLERNIQQRRNDMNVRHGYNYNMEQGMCYCNSNASITEVRRENELLKREKYHLQQLLDMEQNRYDVSRDISMNSNVSSDMTMEYETEIRDNSVAFPESFPFYCNEYFIDK